MIEKNERWFRFDTPWTDTPYVILGELVDANKEEQDWTFNNTRADLYKQPLSANIVRKGKLSESCMAGMRGVLVVSNALARQIVDLVGDEIDCVPVSIRGKQTHQALSMYTKLDCVDEQSSSVELGIMRGERYYKSLRNTTFFRNKVSSHLFRLKYQSVIKFCSGTVRKILESSGGCNLEFQEVRITDDTA